MGKRRAVVLLLTALCGCGQESDGGLAQPTNPPRLEPGAVASGPASAAGSMANAMASPSAAHDAATATDAARAGAGGSGAGQPDAGGAGSGQLAVPQPMAAAPALSHSLEPITIAPGEERTGLCQSWTLNNEQTLYVNKVVSTNQGGFHHSNWIWVDDQSFTGQDGSWPCEERGFDQIFAAAFGGVFFAQSTQAGTDTQAFPDQVAFELPPHVRIIGDLHLLNVADRERTTSLHFDLYTLPEAQVRVKLQPMAFTNTALEVAAGGATHAHMQCAVPQPDFDIYYVMPHFHELGQRLQIDVAGGALDTKTIFTSRGSFGDAMGQTFDPPISVRGAAGLGISCDYQNPSATVRHYGVGADEMCVVLIYSTGAKAGGTAISNVSTDDSNGVHDTDALCVAVGT